MTTGAEGSRRLPEERGSRVPEERGTSVSKGSKGSQARTTWLRGTAAVLLVVYSAVLLVVLFSPSSRVQSDLVFDLVYWLRRHGIDPGLVTYTRMEIVMNAVIIAPVSFLGSFVVRRISWQDWTAYAFLGATTVELVQGIALPNRQASLSDIVANTAGALLGALVARVVWGSIQDRPPLHDS